MRLRVAGIGSGADAPLIAIERRAALLPVFTAATIVLGLLALAIATVVADLPRTIAVTPAAEPWSRVVGVGLWTVFALAGGFRIVRVPSGHGVITFHLPFIVAAMVLGGPIAGGWVALIGTFDRRELREAPWYGVAANHAALALAAVLGGLAVQVMSGITGGFAINGLQAVALLGAIVGTLVFTVVSIGLAVGTIVLRDGLTARETLYVFDRGFRGTAVAETLLGWVLAVVWLGVGPWAPPLISIVVLAVWRTNVSEDERDRDELTGVLSRKAFALRVAEAADRGRRGIEGAAYVFLDLDGFKAVNDGPRDHGIGDEVLVELGLRLRRAVRVTDAVGRRGGDEFMVLFVGVRDDATALVLAERIHDAVTLPYATAAGEKRVGASVGVTLVVPHARDFEPDLRQRADSAMYDAKQAGGGVRMWRPADS